MLGSCALLLSKVVRMSMKLLNFLRSVTVNLKIVKSVRVIYHQLLQLLNIATMIMRNNIW